MKGTKMFVVEQAIPRERNRRFCTQAKRRDFWELGFNNIKF